MSDKPKISVVTIAFNDAEGLRSTIASVLEQTYLNIEYIVIDGGSSDGSVSLIQENKKSITYCVSEPDSGIYDAINKGIRHCSGEWVIFMNAGDEFANFNVVKEVFETPIPQEVDFIYGDKIVKYAGYQIRHVAGLVDNMWKGSQFSHQSVFIKADFQRSHAYNTANRISADFEVFFAASLQGSVFRKVGMPISRVNSGGLSDRARLENIVAFYQVVRRLQPTFKVHVYFLMLLPLQYLKIQAKRLLPESLVASIRRAREKLS